MKKTTVALIIILCINLFLSVYGINWGLPNRWCVDEQVANTLRLISSKSIFTVVDIGHPTFYNLILAIFILPYLLFLKIIGYNFSLVQSAASVSWIKLTEVDPGFATNVYILSRLLSALLNLASILMVYKIGRLIYKAKEIPLISALILAVSMGFIETGHFAKSTSLVIFLLLLVNFYVFKGLSENFKKNFYIASFLSGLAITTKFDGGLAIIYLAIGFIIYLWKNKIKLNYFSFLSICLFLFSLGFIIGWSSIFVNFDKYRIIEEKAIYIPDFNWQLLSIILERTVEYFIHIICMFGPPLSIFIFAGIIYEVYTWKKNMPYFLIFISMLLPYFIIALVFFTRYPGAYTKFVIHSLPIFSLWGGAFIYNFIRSGFVSRRLKFLCIAFTFVFSIIYVLRADAVFTKYDTRYISSKWILANISTQATIEHFQEVDLLFSAAILRTHHIIFNGRDSQDYKNKNFYKFDNPDIVNKYREKLNSEGTKSDYLVVAMGKDFLSSSYLQTEKDKQIFFYRLVDGKVRNYKLIKRLEFKESLLWNPRPAYTAPIICIYKRVL